MEWAKDSETLKLLNAELALYELRIKGKIIRVMTYVHNDQVPVYLFDFEGHQGKTGQIRKEHMEKAQKLAKIAKECLGGECI